MEVEEVTLRAATALLADWNQQRNDLNQQRDQRVRIAYASGLSKNRISQLAGLARETVDNILREPRP